MISIDVDIITDETTEETATVTIPCDLSSVIDVNESYIISDTSSDVADVVGMYIADANEALQKINDGCPGMTEEMLSALVSELGGDLCDESFVDKLSSNDFFFQDITSVAFPFEDIESAAGFYIGTELGLTWDDELPDEFYAMIQLDPSVHDWIDWFAVWTVFSDNGFHVIEDPCSDNVYLIHWKV